MGSRDIVKLFIVPLFIGKTGKWWGLGKDSCLLVKTPVAMSEEQQVTFELWEIIPPGSRALMGESQTGKGFDSRMSIATAVPL